MASRLISLLGLLAASTTLLTGCGGGSGSGTAPGPLASSASVEGYVYAPATAAVATTQVGGVANCRVVARRVSNGTQLGATTADGAGRYRLQGLPAGVAAQIEASLGTGDRLRARLTLRDGVCVVDIDESSTMLATCLDLLETIPPEPGVAAPFDEEAIADRCLRYHTQNRYRYGSLNGRHPDFGDDEAVRGAARQLLAAACDHAVGQALGTGAAGDCRSAVEMVMVRLRLCGAMGYTWNEEVQRRIVAALGAGWRGQAATVAEVAARIGGGAVAEEDIQRLREQLRLHVPAFQERPIDALQAMACLCLRHQTTGRAIAADRRRAQECAEALFAG
jgi:hypothetical protein